MAKRKDMTATPVAPAPGEAVVIAREGPEPSPVEAAAIPPVPDKSKRRKKRDKTPHHGVEPEGRGEESAVPASLPEGSLRRRPGRPRKYPSGPRAISSVTLPVKHGREVYEEFARRVSYDPDTGVFTWLVTACVDPGVRGKLAGALCGKYIVIRHKCWGVFAHRLAWFIVYGEVPQTMLDHINMEKCDNRIANLRKSDCSRNGLNSKVKLGKYKRGAQPRGDRWQASISISGVRTHLGMFASEQEAHEAYMAAMGHILGQEVG